ncbi:MAG: TauD/TfdA family dioxygenase [Alphaproteobacteria bacterium]
MTDTVTIRSAEPQADEVLQVSFSDGHTTGYHFVWLRHDLFFPTAQGAKSGDATPSFPDAPGAVTPRHIDTAGDTLAIDWSDGRATRHDAAWLRRHAYDRTTRQAARHRPVLWDSRMGNGLPALGYDRVAAGDDGRLAVARQVRDYGFARLTNVPTSPGTVAQVAGLFGVPSQGKHGPVSEIKVDSAFNYGGTEVTEFLPLHTDNNYGYYPPGISFFHCLAANPGGGDSFLADGFAIAMALRDESEEAFDLLASTPLPYSIQSDDLDYRAHGRTITLDGDGNLAGIRFSDRALDPLDVPPDQVRPVYDALARWVRLLHDPRFQIRYHMEPGDMSVYDNQRILHGRTYYEPGQGLRHMQSCFVSRQHFHSELRVLLKAVGAADADLWLAEGARG